MYKDFLRRAAEVMKRVEPLPPPLQAVERWEDCGQGADPLCDAVVLLVDDVEHDEPPLNSLTAALESKGWFLHQDGNLEVRYEHADGGIALMETLSDRDARGATGLFDRGFVKDHGADGIVYLAVLPHS